MKPARTLAQEAAEDIFFGQIVLIWARWFFILAGAVLALWSAKTVPELTATILLVAALMAFNFLVHGRYLLERPANRLLLTALGVLDLIIVTALVLGWKGQGGLQSELFIFYYPLVFAFALVFPPPITAAYTLVVLGMYTAVCGWVDPAFIWDVGKVETLVMRLVTLAAMGGLGTYYWRIQRTRRRAALGRPAAVSRRASA